MRIQNEFDQADLENDERSRTCPMPTPTPEYSLDDAMGWLAHANSRLDEIDTDPESPLGGALAYMVEHRAEIVKAVNAHEELVRACNIFLEAVEHVSGIDESRKAFIKAVEKSDAK